MSLLIKILLFLIIIQLVLVFIDLLKASYKYFLIKELDLSKRYGNNTWVVITGASSGQGRDMALAFAKRNFNILMIGSKRTDETAKEIQSLHPHIKTKIIYKDFRKAFENNFFDDIQLEFDKLNTDIALLINNVGYRVGWKPYHEMPDKYIRDTIATGTIVQSKLTHMVIPFFLQRKQKGLKSGLINITAQCMHSNFLFGINNGNEISVPFLSVYEASNAFGFYHSNSIYKEYKNDFDILNITPGAVITPNTKCLSDTIFSIDSKTFVNNIIKMIGNVNGYSCAYWGHAFSTFLINFVPFIKDKILYDVGRKIATDFENKEKVNNKSYDV